MYVCMLGCCTCVHTRDKCNKAKLKVISEEEEVIKEKEEVRSLQQCTCVCTHWQGDITGKLVYQERKDSM